MRIGIGKNRVVPMLLAVCTSATWAFATEAAAQTPAQSAYLTTSDGTPVRAAAAGVCVHTGYWTPAMARADCDPARVPKQVAVAAPVTPRQAPAIPMTTKSAPPAPPARPAPPKPAPVTAIVKKLTLHSDALFGFDRSVLTVDGRSKLDELATEVRGANIDSITVVGYTDRLGSTAYNQKLSLHRAEAVKDYLVRQHIPAGRIHAEGRGESNPVKECRQKKRSALIACLQPNRRVEIQVLGTR